VEAAEEFQWLFTREYAAIVWSANVVLHDYARSEEVAQEAFIRLLDNWAKVSRYDRPGAWVRRVAIRLATKAARKESRLVSMDHAWPTIDDAPVDLDLMAAIRQLPPKQRAVIALYYIEDMAAADVAEVLGCAVATVSVHLHRARARLAELLGEEVDSHAS
jgi:RNA polymerase sigma-70 factor (ECF subfamily)